MSCVVLDFAYVANKYFGWVFNFSCDASTELTFVVFRLGKCDFFKVCCRYDVQFHVVADAF